MDCEYMYYQEDSGEYYPRLLCRATNGKFCLYSRRCDLVHKFIPIENNAWEDCYIMVEEKIKSIPKGSYYVKTYKENKKGKLYLYIVIGEKIERVLTDFEEINQNYVYIKEKEDGYDVSLVPFKEEEKETIVDIVDTDKKVQKTQTTKKRYENKRN